MTEINHLKADLEFVEKALEIVHYQLHGPEFYLFNVGMLVLMSLAGSVVFYCMSDKFQGYLKGKGRLAACAVAVTVVCIVASLTTLSVAPAKALKLSQVSAATFKVDPAQEYERLFGSQQNVSVYQFETQKRNLVTKLLWEKGKLEQKIKISGKVKKISEAEAIKLRANLIGEES